jgi:hypothetical protein
MKLFLRQIAFQLKCMFFGLGIDIENVATAHETELWTPETDNIRPEVGSGLGAGSWCMSPDDHRSRR